MTLAELTAAVDMLKARGVAKFTDTPGNGFSIEFFPAADRAATVENVPAQKDDELCACGHTLHIQHMNGMCVEGCTNDECNPEKPK